MIGNSVKRDMVLFVAFPEEELDESSQVFRRTVPFSLLYLAHYLKRHSVESVIHDLSLVMDGRDLKEIKLDDYLVEELSEIIAEKNPLCLGVSCFASFQFPLMKRVLKRIKEHFPTLPIVIGGTHPTLYALQIMENCSFIDYVVLGEGEEQVLELTYIVKSGSYSELENIQALAYRDTNRQIIINPRKSYLRVLDDEKPANFWSSIDLQNYHFRRDVKSWYNPKRHDIRYAVPIMTSRSCPFDCSFCANYRVMGRKMRFRDPERVVNEIEYLNKEHGENYFEFLDDNVVLNREHALNIFKGIKDRGLDIQFSLINGFYIPSIDDKLIDVMAEAGLVSTKIPVEHGNDYIRNSVIGKKVKKDEVCHAVKRLYENRVFSIGLFIIGFPEDTVDTLDDSLRFVEELKELGMDMSKTANLAPIPGSRVFEQCLKENLLLNDIDPKTLWQGRLCIDSLDHDKFYIKPYNMTMYELYEYRRRFNDVWCLSERSKQLNKTE